ncbi:MAG: hypothetical protein J0H62_01920 [Rhizobiales bacterium]|nr:hypothetical protein [Hyphomicrobiales bacterium]
MASIKRFNWTRLPSAWEMNQSWAARRAAMRSDFDTQNTIAQNAFQAVSDQASGMTELAAKAAASRITSETQTLQASLSSPSLDTTV